MNRRDNMTARLPPIYNTDPGSVLHDFFALFSTHMTAYDEDMNRVQRSHWVDTAFDRMDVVKLGALFDIPAAPWEPLHLYRSRLKATIAARFKGAVTRDALEFVLLQILDGAQKALGVTYFDLPSSGSAFHTGPPEQLNRAAFIEFPTVRKRCDALLNKKGLVRPLAKFSITNVGFGSTPLMGIIRGVAGRRTAVPVLVNLTNGMVLTYIGYIRCGESLELGVDGNGDITAVHNGIDVREKVYTGTAFEAGAQFTPAIPDEDPHPLLLERGENRLWFFPLALYDEPVLGTGVFGMPDADLEHGRWADKSNAEHGGTLFDQSLFEQPPAASLDIWWDEEKPACFRFDIPSGVIRRTPQSNDEAEANHTRLFAMLQQTVSLLRAAGVDGRVDATRLRDTQILRDNVHVLPSPIVCEEMRVETRIGALSALFDKNAIDGSRFT